MAGRVAWASGGGESGGVEWWLYTRACSKAGGEESGGGEDGGSGGDEEAVLPRLEGAELFNCRAIAEREEVLRDPGDRWMR